MKTVYCVYEDNYGMVGLATNYQSAIDGLIEEKWLHENTELVDENGNFYLLKEKLGKKWLEKIKAWDSEKFNIFFEGVFWISSMEIWGS